MKKILQKHIMIVHCLILIIVGLLEICLITRNDYMFGSNGDWLKQSVEFRHYFRNLFYETKNLFPNWALHLGGGQNIYYFVYYGLFSPYVLFSYLFPFIKMGDFIILTNILNIIVSSILLYIFFVKNGYVKNQSLIGALILLSSTSFIVQNYGHIMFVQYMPFLILGLIGTKKYFDSQKSFLLIVSVALIILTSYYYSIPSIICLFLYALYYDIKKDSVKPLKKLLKDVLNYILRIILGIMIAGFLLLPVIYTLINGRTSVPSTVTISSLIPNIDTKNFMYGAFGLGLTAIVIFAIVYNILYLKKSNKILAIILLFILSVPFFNLLLNGFLYINGKVFIPFIPIFIMLIIEMICNIKDIESKKINFAFACSILSSIVFINHFDVRPVVVLRDLLFTFFLLSMYNRRKKLIYVLPIMVYAFYVTIHYARNDNILITTNEYNDIYNRMNNDMSYYINHNTDSIYRYEDNSDATLLNYSNASYDYITSVYSSTSNTKYQEIFYNTFNNNFKNSNILTMFEQKNLFFQKFMGIRYFFTTKDAPYGYEKVKEYENGILYENKNVYPIGFASNHLLNYDDYQNLSFIKKLEAYQNNIIIDGKSVNSDLEFNYEKIDLNYRVEKISNLSWIEENNHYLVKSEDNGEIILSLNEVLKEKSLVVRFYINNDSICDNKHINDGHLAITINDIQNTLTCSSNIYYNNNKTFDYVISSNDDIYELKITFYKGEYNISDIEIYSIPNSFFDKNETTPINIDFTETKGDKIKGTIDMLEDGYFIFTIPYDEGYTILVDGKQVNIEKVNEGFIGFKIEKGFHTIELFFEAPYSTIGKIISVIGIILFVILIKYEKKKSNY